jgi:DNA modification methylase/endonuclease YncB( thermonuclease family)
MSSISDESVHLVVTSPPYWQLKDYGVKGQIGFDDSYESYINNLNLVWMECARVLHPGCRLCVNIGDQFARSVYYGRYKVIPIRTEIVKFCEAIGLDYMGAIIWQKVTTTNTTGGATIMGSFPYPRNGILKLDYEFILIFKKLGNPPRASARSKEDARLTTEEWNRYFTGHWNFPGEKQEGHIARFPLELPHRLIRMFSFSEETVLDPFTGSGTTNVAAAHLNRHSIGIEVNPEFAHLAVQRLEKEKSLISDIEIVIKKQKPLGRKELDGLHTHSPHRFVDPVRIDKKTDPRKLLFGSKITGKESDRRIGHRVERVVSPCDIELEGGQVVRLLGVTPCVEHASDAISYLDAILRGHQVNLKFDAMKYDENGRLLAYVYLANKTFVNGHLLRSGLVHLDTSRALAKRTSLKRYATRGRVVRAV